MSLERNTAVTRRLSRATDVVEAAFLILLVRVGSMVLEFPAIMRIVLSGDARSERHGRDRAGAVSDVRRAVFSAWRRLPVRNTCFHRSVVAFWMLRRRGVNATLCYGAKFSPQDGLTGHMWVLDGAEGVVGHEAANGYPLLACFSNVSGTDMASVLRRMA